MEFINQNLEKLGINPGDWSERMVQKLKAYKEAIIKASTPPTPEVTLTKDEEAGIDKLIAEYGKELGNNAEGLKKALLEFKKLGYLDNLTSADVSKAEIEFINQNLEKLGINPGDWSERMQQKLQEYKKILMRG